MSEATRSEIVRVGIDLAKRVIDAHGVDAAGKLLTRRSLSRAKFLPWCAQLPPGCVVAMEACSGAHYWARRLAAMGLQPRLIAAQFVAPYRLQGKSGKNDANDAAAVCEAASRPNMHFVPVKSVEQQGWMAVHRLREGFKQERTACINRIRGLLSEFGLVFPQGSKALRQALPLALEDGANELPAVARYAVQRAQQHWQELDEHLAWCDARIAEHVRSSEAAQQAARLQGIGALGASALVAGVGDLHQFKSGAQFSAWLGVVPSQHSSGGKVRLGGITKRGDEYLRMLLIRGAKAAVDTAAKRDDRLSRWLVQLCARVGWQKAAVALANKNARILWAILTRGARFDPNHVPSAPPGPGINGAAAPA
ncbi:IS110 family transposase [Azohydromonas aeria]|uniref:IS110 family transposase n=1 Tax=Azohydromonas aeria TaxID=2590212 RepID=UPI0012FBDE7B|nr:IS110 family transposase [Azohydromonas aeria]